jgi:hypothetical protein
MNEQFHRRALLLLKVPGETAKPFKDVRITFKVEKSSESTPNNAIITLYNLNKESISLFEKENSVIELYVGYGGYELDNPRYLLFKGDIIFSSSAKKGSELITKIEAGDSENNIVTKHTNRSYAPGQKTDAIIKQLVNDLGLILTDKNIKDVDTSELNQTSLSLFGSTRDLLDTLIKSKGLEWNVHNGEVYIYNPNKKVPDDERVFSFNKNTGLIHAAKAKEKYVNFKALINPLVFPNRVIRLDYDLLKINGFYKVRTAVYNGDTHEGDWSMQCESVENVNA